MLLGERVHPRAGGEVVGRLGATVQHDDQGNRLPMIATGDVELVNASAGLVAVGSYQETVRRPVRRRARAPRRALGKAPLCLARGGSVLTRSRKPRSTWRRCGWVVPGVRPDGRLLAPVPDASARCAMLGIGQLDRVRRQVDDARARVRQARARPRRSGRTQCPTPARRAARVAGGAVPSVSLPARVRRVASGIMSECSASSMSGAFLGLFGKRSGGRARKLIRLAVEKVVGNCSRRRRCQRRVSQVKAGGASHPRHRIRSARAALTAGLARRAPSTTTNSIVAQASSGVTSWAMLARPSTWMWSVWPAARTASRSSRL